MTLITPGDRLVISGARGTAASAISHDLYRSGYTQQLKPSRDDVDLLDSFSLQQWFSRLQLDAVVLAAVKVGGIHAKNTYPADL